MYRVINQLSYFDATDATRGNGDDNDSFVTERSDPGRDVEPMTELLARQLGSWFQRSTWQTTRSLFGYATLKRQNLFHQIPLIILRLSSLFFPFLVVNIGLSNFLLLLRPIVILKRHVRRNPNFRQSPKRKITFYVLLFFDPLALKSSRSIVNATMREQRLKKRKKKILKIKKRNEKTKEKNDREERPTTESKLTDSSSRAR